MGHYEYNQSAIPQLKSHLKILFANRSTYIFNFAHKTPKKKSFIHRKRTILLVFMQALKKFVKAKQWPGMKRTCYCYT